MSSLGILVGFLLFWPTVSLALSVGVGGAPPGAFDATGDGNSLMVDIGTPTGRIPIFADPAAAPWDKVVTINLAQTGGLNQGAVIHIWEYLQFQAPPQGVPPLNITDWHEQIVPTGSTGDIGGQLEWGPNTAQVPGGPAPVINGDQISFFFEPALVPPGPMDIHKDLIYNGVTLTGIGSVSFKIQEMPTVPEPSTLALLAFGLVALVAARHRTLQS